MPMSCSIISTVMPSSSLDVEDEARDVLASPPGSCPRPSRRAAAGSARRPARGRVRRAFAGRRTACRPAVADVLDLEEFDDLLDLLPRRDLLAPRAARRTSRHRTRWSLQMWSAGRPGGSRPPSVLEQREVLEGARRCRAPQARRCELCRVISSPSNRIRPRLGRSTPLIRLNRVVLPAPFGPITLQISPALDGEADVGDRLQAAEASC